MQKSNLLFFLLAILMLVACNNNQNAASDGTATDADADTEVMNADSAKAKIQEMQGSKSVTTTTAKPRAATERPTFRLQDRSGNIFSGEFAYMADAAYFINCSTGNRYSVAFQDAFIDLEKAYLKLTGEEAGKRVYAVLDGEFTNKPKEEGDLMKGTLIVKKLVSLSDEASCESVVRRMGGMYASLEDAGTFKDCRNKQQFSVEHSGAFAALEEAYATASNGSGTPAYVEFYGFTKAVSADIGGTSKTAIVVTRVVGFDRSYSCE
jgi:uncharacterized lipoprotein NlpE involved in copper resistance